MFDQLVQSNSHNTAKQGAYMGITTLIYGSLLIAVMVWSIFSFDLSSLNEGDLAYSELVAPIALPENVPPVVLPDRPLPKVAALSNDKGKVDVIKNPVKDISSSTDSPDKVLTDKSNATAVRDKVPFIIRDGGNQRATDNGEMPIRTGATVGVNNAIGNNSSEQIKETDVAPPPSLKSANPPVVKKDVIISIGVINGRATDLPKPAYPPAARQIHASGEVKVQVLIDERGNVTSATVLSGHPLLRHAAQTAARNARFTPTLLSKQPVKVNGIIVYNFVAQ